MVHSPDKKAAIKVALVGGVGVGKTSLASRLTSGTWSVELEATSGVSFQLVTLGDGERLHMWDVAGDPRFAEVSASSYFRSIQGVVLCYDTTRPESLSEVTPWVEQLKQWAPAGVQAVLCGTKHEEGPADELLQRRVVALASRLCIPSVLTSAKTGKGVREAFGTLVRAVRKQQAQVTTVVETSVGGPLTEIKLTEESPSVWKRSKGHARPALAPIAEPCQSIAARFTCPVFAATLGPCGSACARLSGMASDTQRQPPAADQQEITQASQAWTCEPSDGAGAVQNPSRAPACKRQLRA